jgi:lysophospholipase L1-like esterase
MLMVDSGDSTPAPQITLHVNDRIVVLGDSLTQAASRSSAFLALLGQALSRQFGDGAIRIINAGVSGNRTRDCVARLEKDVLAHQPAVVVIFVGVNDVWYSTRGEVTRSDEYAQQLTHLVSACQQSGATVVLCTPALIGEKTDGSNSLDTMMDEFAATCRRVAQEKGAVLLDLRGEFLNHLKKHNPTNRPHSVLTTDGIHLNTAGNALVARILMQTFGINPAQQPARLLRHVVMFKFKPEAGIDQIEAVVAAFEKLPQQIDSIYSFESGTDVSVEGLSQGFTHCFFVTFGSEVDRQIYLSHPQHKAFSQLARPNLADVIVVDYWTAGKS